MVGAAKVGGTASGEWAQVHVNGCTPIRPRRVPSCWFLVWLLEL